MSVNQKKLLDISNKIVEVFSKIGDENLVGAQRLLHSRIADPRSFVTMVGETSSGKSTVINGFYHEALLPTSTTPTSGTVTQIFNDCDINENQYSAINKDGTYEPLKREMFDALSLKPDENLLRLQIDKTQSDKIYDDLNLFDTPGYNSLQADHELILRTFIPESDVVIFTVLYRNGFTLDDQFLLSSISELSTETNEDISENGNLPVLLVINRCPDSATLSDNRVKVIISHAEDTLGRSVKPFLVHSVINEDDTEPVFPQAKELWVHTAQIITNDERELQILKRGRGFLENMIKEAKLDLESKILTAELDASEIAMLKSTLDDFTKSKDKLFKILDKYCNKWQRTLPNFFTSEMKSLIASTESAIITDRNKWMDVNACTAYIGNHHLSSGMRKINRDFEFYLINDLENMNKEMEDVANQAIKKLALTTQTMPEGSYKKIIQNLVAKIGLKMLGNTIKSLMIRLGGRGGLAAGLGNLVKMEVKRVGNLFGKTFSREVYNRIGKSFTKESLKRINVAITVIIEFGLYIIHSKTWQKKLIQKTTTELENIETEIKNKTVAEVIKNLKKENEATITKLYDELNSDVQKEIESLKEDGIEEKLDESRRLLQKIIKLQTEIGALK